MIVFGSFREYRVEFYLVMFFLLSLSSFFLQNVLEKPRSCWVVTHMTMF